MINFNERFQNQWKCIPYSMSAITNADEFLILFHILRRSRDYTENKPSLITRHTLKSLTGFGLKRIDSVILSLQKLNLIHVIDCKSNKKAYQIDWEEVQFIHNYSSRIPDSRWAELKDLCFGEDDIVPLSCIEKEKLDEIVNKYASQFNDEKIENDTQDVILSESAKNDKQNERCSPNATSLNERYSRKETSLTRDVVQTRHLYDRDIVETLHLLMRDMAQTQHLLYSIYDTYLQNQEEACLKCNVSNFSSNFTKKDENCERCSRNERCSPNETSLEERYSRSATSLPQRCSRKETSLCNRCSPNETSLEERYSRSATSLILDNVPEDDIFDERCSRNERCSPSATTDVVETQHLSPRDVVLAQQQYKDNNKDNKDMMERSSYKGGKTKEDEKNEENEIEEDFYDKNRTEEIKQEIIKNKLMKWFGENDEKLPAYSKTELDRLASRNDFEENFEDDVEMMIKQVWTCLDYDEENDENNFCPAEDMLKIIFQVWEELKTDRNNFSLVEDDLKKIFGFGLEEVEGTLCCHITPSSIKKINSADPTPSWNLSEITTKTSDSPSSENEITEGMMKRRKNSMFIEALQETADKNVDDLSQAEYATILLMDYVDDRKQKGHPYCEEATNLQFQYLVKEISEKSGVPEKDLFELWKEFKKKPSAAKANLRPNLLSVDKIIRYNHEHDDMDVVEKLFEEKMAGFE